MNTKAPTPNASEQVQKHHLPSVDSSVPLEQGGPIARTGFDYQDHVAVGFLLEMLGNPELEKVHCETQDDIVLVWCGSGEKLRTAEYVQVKSDLPDQLWSTSKLCQRHKGKVGSSIFEKSLERDRCKEPSLFRICTQREPNSALSCLTHEFCDPRRATDTDEVKALVGDLEKKCGTSSSKKGNGAAFWVQNCKWDYTESMGSLEARNVTRVLELASNEPLPVPLLPDQARAIARDLLVIVKDASSAPCQPDLSEKIITRDWLLNWWQQRFQQLLDGASTAAGGMLRSKLNDALVSEDTIQLAIEQRRRFAELRRNRGYLELDDPERMIDRIGVRAAQLQMNADVLDKAPTGQEFHQQCVDAVDAIANDFGDDLQTFARGGLYDIADRCLHRFRRPSK